MKTNQNEKNTQKDKLPKLRKKVLPQQKLFLGGKERMMNIYSESGVRRVPVQNTVTFDIDENPQKTNNSIRVVKCKNNCVEILFENFKETPDKIEISMSKENVKSLLSDLRKVYGEDFPQSD